MLIIILIKHLLACEFEYPLDYSTKEVKIDIQWGKFTRFGIWTRQYTFYQDKHKQTRMQQDEIQIVRGFDKTGKTQMQYKISDAYHWITLNQRISYGYKSNYDEQLNDKEGVWIFTQLGFDQQNNRVQILIVNTKKKTDSIIYSVISDRVGQIDSVVIYEQFDQYLNPLNIFYGQISFVQSQISQIKFSPIEQLLEQLISCNPNNYCHTYSANRLISGILNTFQQSFQYTQINNYWIDGWFLFTPLDTMESHSNIFLKIIQHKNESVLYNGMISLQIQLNFNRDNEENNSIIVENYPYKFPKWFEEPNIPVQSIINYKLEQIKSWVYFRFIQYEQNDSNAEFYLSFSDLDVNKNMGKLNLFQYGEFYIYLGFSQLYSNRFIGLIANVNIQTCLLDYSQAKRVCHYTCLTCSGPMNYHCLTCSTQSNRIYDTLSKTCQCGIGYLAAEGELQCVDIKKAMKQSTYSHFDFNLFNSQPCKKGQFQYQIESKIRCYDCPQQYSSSQIQCADCLENLFEWQYNMICSYDYYQAENIKENAFIKYIRPQSKIDYYYIQEELLLCQGCLYEGEKQLVKDKTILYGSCNQNYYYKDNSCYPCQSNCQSCEDINGQCSLCEIGYVLNNHICYSCPDYCLSCSYTVKMMICSQCLQGFTPGIGICWQCGANCLNCQFDTQNNIPRCLACKDMSYFLLFDGVNCSLNTIENCITEYQSYDSINTLVYNFQLQLNKVDIVNKCALCQSNYMNYGTYCEENTNLKPDEQVLNVDGNQIYLISSSQQQFNVLNNCFENQCNKCLQVKDNQKCIQCSQGYYANMLSGKCIECPSQQNCQTCQEQNQYYKDGWKWNIRAYFKYSFKSMEFEDVAASKDINDYEIICLTCPNGYMLFNNTCILNCPVNCKKCLIIDGKNICTFCGIDNYGSLLTTYVNQCTNCPHNCEFCQPRSQDEIYDINALFNPDDTSKNYFTYICLQPKSDPEIYYNQFLQQYVKCQDAQNCQNQLNIKLKAHCDQQSYAKEQKNYINKQDFYYENVLVSNIFSNSGSHFSDIETPQFIEFLNINQIASLIYEITLISSSDSCSITNFIHSKIPRNVFSTVKSKLLINGNNLTLSSQNAQILNFSEVEIYQTRFQLPFYILISHPNQLIVNFRNINYVSQQTNNNDIDIIIVNPLKIEIYNFYIVAIEQLKTTTSYNNMISYYYTNSSTVTNLNIKMDNLQFIKSQFHNIDFLIIKADSRILDIMINISNSIIESTFQNASFIKESQMSNYGQVILLNVTFIVEVFQASLIDLNGQLNLTGSVKLVGSLTQSNFISTNQFQIGNLQVYNTYLYNSTIIDNKIQQQDNQVNVLQINNSIFYRVFYDNLSNFISIIDNYLYDFLIIQNFQTIECQFASKYHIKTPQRLIMFEGFHFELLHSKFNKSILGLTDLSIKYCQTVKIDNVTVVGYNIQGLQNKLDCYNLLVDISLQNSFIQLENIKKIQLMNSQFNDIMIQNYPIIGIYCHDDSIEYEILLENISFSNNLILITEFRSQASIFQVLSSQNGNLTAINVSFIENVLNEYQQNQFQNIATTFLIEAEEFNILLKNNIFNKNLLFNSSDSVLFIQVQQIIIQNSTFTKSNMYDDFILSFVIWGSTQKDFYQENFQEIFPIFSVGGNGRLVADTIAIDQCQFSYSTAQQGSGFHVTLQNLLEITNSTFIGLRNKLNQDDSQGGSIFINLISINAALKISDTLFNNTYSLFDGGAIYINSRYTTSNISLTQITVINCYSFRGTFISAYLNKYSTITVKKISIKNDILTFQHYLGEIQNVTENYVEQFHNSSAIFFIQYGSLYISDCTVSDIQFSSVLYFYSASNLYVYDSVIQNVRFSSQGLIQLYPTSNTDTITFIKNIQILNCNNVHPEKKDCQNKIDFNSTDFQCFNYNKPNSLSLYPKDTQSKIICFEQRLLHFTSSSSMIYVNIIQVSDYFYLSNLKMINNNCSYCKDGMITLKNVEINTPEINNIKFEQLQFQNNTCGSGCLVVSQESIITFPYTRLLQSLLYQSRFTIQSTIILEQSEFFNNTAQNGIVIVSNLSLVVLDAKFIKNNGTDISGGILFLGNQNNTFHIMTSEISNSTGNRGGALYLGKKTLSSTQLLQVLLSSNNATSFGKDFASTPQELTISLNPNKSFLQTKLVTKTQQVIQEVVIDPYKILGNKTLQEFIFLPSGYKIKNYQYYEQNISSFIPYNLSLRIIALNSLKQQMIELEKSTCTIKKRKININSNSSGNFEQLGLSITNISFNTTSKDYNLDDLEIDFDPYQPYNDVLQLQFKCTSIQIPVINDTPPYNILDYLNNYELRMNVKTFKCQRGEFYNGSACILCDSSLSLYSVIIKDDHCNVQDETTMEEINSTHINLKKNFWRPYDHNDIITQCYNLPDNCKGGWSPGDKSCESGHIGALCEQCDLYNVRGFGSHALSGQFQCGSCSNLSINTLSIILIIIWSLITIFLSVKGTVENVDELVIRTRGTKAGFVCVYFERGNLNLLQILFLVQVAVLMKILTNYLQIISTLGTFRLKLPPGLRDVFAYTGSPVKSMVYSLDCFLVDLSNIEILYFRNLWSIFMPFYYSTIIFIIYFAIIKIRDMKLNITVLSTTLIYIFILVQPDIIGGFISLLSYRKISEVSWVQGNVSYLYSTSEHRKWLVSFVVPVLIIFGFLIPLVLYLNMSKFKHKLEDTNVLRLYGYLYNEYSKVTYYWEILKICQKELIIIFLTFYEDIIIIKGTLVFVIIFCYDIFSKTYRPYKRVDLNQLDSQNSFVCAFSIVLGMTIHFADQNGNIEIIWPFYVLMGIFNFFFILRMISLLILGYLYQMNDLLDQIRNYIKQKFPNIIINYPWLNKYLENSQVKSKRVKQRYLKLREYLWKKAQLNKEQTKNQKLETEPYQEIEQKQLKEDLQADLKGDFKQKQQKTYANIPIHLSISNVKSDSQSIKVVYENNQENINITLEAQKMNRDNHPDNDNDNVQNKKIKQNNQSDESVPSEFEDNQEFDFQLNISDSQKNQDNEEQQNLSVQQ